MIKIVVRGAIVGAAMLLLPALSPAQLTSAQARQVAAIARQAMADSGAPSVSLAIVADGRIYAQAFGDARLLPARVARPDMRYKIGSVSKQFLAASLLMLQARHRLSLADRVGKYLPGLTRANDVTMRELLTHTSGYEDYYALDYVAPFMLRPVTAQGILDRWAKKPLDFAPGTKWQYSNTNYVIAGEILEKITGAPLFAFLRANIFRPLGMSSVIDLDRSRLGAADPLGYTRFGLGPWRPAPPEGRGWLFAAGELAMTAGDLARWDRGLLSGQVLSPAEMRQFMTPATLADGAPTGYALGVDVGSFDDTPVLSHSGGVSGFVSHNTVWLGRSLAVCAFTNADGSPAPSAIVRQVGAMLLRRQDPAAAARLQIAEQVFRELQRGRLDRSRLTLDAQAYFTAQTVADARASLGPLGSFRAFEQTSVITRGGMEFRHYRISFASGRVLRLTVGWLANGGLEEFLIQ